MTEDSHRLGRVTVASILLGVSAKLLHAAYLRSKKQTDPKLVASEKPLVQESSEESFPASDPPAWNAR